MSKSDLKKATQILNVAKDKVVQKAEDINAETIIAQAMKMPGVKIDRKEYLTKELHKYYPNNIVSAAIETTPYKAGVTKQGLDHIAKDSIKYETLEVTAVSAIAGIPGGLAMAATIPADITQYFVFMIRAAQKLAYLYGYPEIELSEDFLDDAAMNELLIFLGVMLGVQEANVALKTLTEIIAQSLPKKLAQKALTKGTIYPMVKKIAQAIGVKMTKDIFSKGVGKVIPVVGGVVSGGLTFVTFKPCCYRLRKELEKNLLSDMAYEDLTI